MNQILHFGPGNFFRAHLADYTQDLGGWSITGVSLRSSGVRDGLSAQGNRYTLAVQGQAPRDIRIIDSIIVGSENPRTVLDHITDARFPVISATVTEKGYHLLPNGHLDLLDPDIAHDLLSDSPRTFIGFLARGLAKRKAPVTVLSCDNRIGNGNALAQAIEEFQNTSGLTTHCQVSFPNGMVDRITPATTAELRTKTGDAMAVGCEPYKEWVIEDRFVSMRPNWPGVQWVRDVAPYEMRKLRMLNGAHSYLAYAGSLAGFTFVHEAIADPDLRQSVRGLMDEAATTLPKEVRFEASTYADALLDRFDNIHVEHKLRQIAMDGSQKVPYRLIDSIRARLASDLTAPHLCAAVKAWIDFIAQETSHGRKLDDPLAVALAGAISTPNPTAAVLDLIGASDITSQFSE
ncbi:mannitol dehydrogenase family protein [uncultured Boseongicola sp.]|jgi:fructuronate reductase|uniref:mannitol dehydrogenase family protein n=1 Tax=uncultured Boseongicola sp. TaxID=1648499 RepID=UPI00260401D1|nr:mannitol dehydrogenase family protein [uncultured Boseongicola sp.]